MTEFRAVAIVTEITLNMFQLQTFCIFRGSWYDSFERKVKMWPRTILLSLSHHNFCTV